MDYLDETLHLWRIKPFTWGGVVPHEPGFGDCLLSVGEYAEGLGAPQITDEFRGLYRTEQGAAAMVEAAGGAVAIVARLGWPETDAPERGDVVVFTVGAHQIGGICTGDSIAARLDRGVIELNRRFIREMKAWSCPR